MSDVQWLFVVLVALYVWECACWLRRGGVAFSSWLGRSWRALPPGSLIANQSGGFVLAAPLPPLGTIFVANQFPLSLSPEGVLGFVATNVNPGWRPAQTGRFVRFEEMQDVQARTRRILVNGELLTTCATPSIARHAADLLRKLGQLPATERASVIGNLCRRGLDVEAVERCRQDFDKRAGTIRILANGLVGYVFFVTPIVIGKVGFKMSWVGLLVGLLALTCTTAICFWRAHRALCPEAHDERFTHTLTILLAPTTAMRALDVLSRPLLEHFHPLAPAQVLLSEPEFRSFAQRIWLDLQHPALPAVPSEDHAAQATELHWRRAWQLAVEEFLRSRGLEPHALSQPPTPNDESCRAYCPRCQAQFTTAEGTCADCGGLPLAAIKR